MAHRSARESGIGEPVVCSPRSRCPVEGGGFTSKGVVVLGAGGHAKVVIELLHAMGEYVDYCVGDTDGPERCLRIPVLKGDQHLPKLLEHGYRKAFIAIGSNSARQRVAEMVTSMGYRLINAISPNSVISPSARLGNGVAVMAGVVINAECVIEDLAIINTGATVDHDCRVGKAAHIAPQCGLAGNVTVGEGAFLGLGCKVTPGIRIGREVTVGAGGVVIADLPSRVVAVGVPAKVISRRRDGERGQ